MLAKAKKYTVGIYVRKTNIPIC